MDFVDPEDTGWPRHDDGAAPRRSLLTAAQWLAVRDRWPAGTEAGVMLANDVDVATIADDLPRLALVVLDFPKWTDGRAYSQARLLRSRHRFGGDLRAAGDVVADMLPLLQRAGFTSVQLRAGQSVATARRALAFFDGYYQADVVDPQPLFAREAR